MKNNKDNKWNKLSMREKADLMKIYLKHGIYDLNQIREHYNNFDATVTNSNSEYTNTYALGGNLFVEGVSKGSNSNLPSDYEMQLAGFVKQKSGLGDNFSKYTEEQYKQYYEQQKAKENYNKQQGQKLIKANKNQPNLSITTPIKENKNNYIKAKIDVDDFLKSYYRSEGFLNKAKKLDNADEYINNAQLFPIGPLTFNENESTYHQPGSNRINISIPQLDSIFTDFRHGYAHERGHALNPNKDKTVNVSSTPNYSLRGAPSKEIEDIVLKYRPSAYSKDSIKGEPVKLTTDELISKQNFFRELFDVFLDNNRRKERKNNSYNHDRNYNEIYSDYIGTIYDAYNNNIYDARKTRKFNHEDYRNLKYYYNINNKRNRLLDAYDEDTFIKLMNTFAYNNPINNKTNLFFENYFEPINV